MKLSSPPFPSPSNRPGGANGLTTGLGYPVTLHWVSLIAFLVLLLVAAFLHAVVLLAISVFFLVLMVVARLWSWQALREVSCELIPGQERAFPGATLELNFTVSNAKRLFLPWLEIEAELPDKLVTGKLKARSTYSKERLRWATAISGGQKISWKHNIECKARGDYQLGPVWLRSGDAFGLFPRETLLPVTKSLLVYPRIVPVDKILLPMSELVGEIGIPRNIYEDNSRTMGARDYQYGDSLKRIHWAATARRNELQARQYESTTSLSLLLLLDTYSFDGDEDTFELAVTTAASLAYEASRQNLSFGLMSNSLPEIHIPVASGRSQLSLLLEALARVKLESKQPLNKQLERYRNDLPVGVTLVIISYGLSLELSALMYRLHQGGYSLLMVSAGQKLPATNFLGIPTVSVLSLADLSRRHEELKR